MKKTISFIIHTIAFFIFAYLLKYGINKIGCLLCWIIDNVFILLFAFLLYRFLLKKYINDLVDLVLNFCIEKIESAKYFFGLTPNINIEQGDIEGDHDFPTPINFKSNSEMLMTYGTLDEVKKANINLIEQIKKYMALD